MFQNRAATAKSRSTRRGRPISLAACRKATGSRSAARATRRNAELRSGADVDAYRSLRRAFDLGFAAQLLEKADCRISPAVPLEASEKRDRIGANGEQRFPRGAARVGAYESRREMAMRIRRACDAPGRTRVAAVGLEEIGHFASHQVAARGDDCATGMGPVSGQRFTDVNRSPPPVRCETNSPNRRSNAVEDCDIRQGPGLTGGSTLLDRSTRSSMRASSMKLKSSTSQWNGIGGRDR